MMLSNIETCPVPLKESFYFLKLTFLMHEQIVEHLNNLINL